jgi:hypothetical protein
VAGETSWHPVHVCGFSLAISHWWLAAIIAGLGLVPVTGYSGTEIDPRSRTFREYTSYLFLRKGMSEKYHGIEKIFINEAKGVPKNVLCAYVEFVNTPVGYL